MKRGSHHLSALSILAGAIAGLVLCEAALRLLSPGENVYATATLGAFAPDQELGWVLKRNFRTPRKWGTRTVLIRTDSAGHRVPDGRPSPQIAQLAFAGDSYVFGNEVNAEETFVELVGQALLKATVNLGVGGYDIGQEALALRRFIAQSSGIVQTFLVIYVGNDIEDGTGSARTVVVDERGYLHHVASDRWSGFRNFAVSRSRLMFYLQQTWAAFRSPPIARGDTDNRRWIYNEQLFTPDRLAKHRSVLRELRDDARSRRVSLTIVLMPERGQIYGSLTDLPNRMLSSLASELDTPVIDLLPKMRAAAARRPPLWYDIVDGHLSPEGHRVVAQILLDALHTSAAMETGQ